ncbi:MAG: hypothetical protein IKZ49_00085 [Alphaproteobacteria bacterium]|nr:hypothetical protein [Alphaproteobacteria bacterium]
MYTNYVKNFDYSTFKSIRNKMENVDNPIYWRGTIYIGTQPLYIECGVEWLAKKIDTYFVKAIENQHIENSKELYILEAGISDFIYQPDWFTTNVYFLGDDLSKKPDLIVHNNCVFLKENNVSFISITNEDEINFYHLGENHLLMRLLNYIFDDESNIILHGAVVGYDNYGILITGLSGAGKSTLSAYCLKNGMQFVGDDRIAISKQGDSVVANPIYTTISLIKPISGLKTTTKYATKTGIKDIFILDKSQFSTNIPICAIIEPEKCELDTPQILQAQKSPILTRICMDYSYYSLLTRSTNPLVEYRMISDLLCNAKSFKLKLSTSIDKNANALFELTKHKGVLDV